MTHYPVRRLGVVVLIAVAGCREERLSPTAVPEPTSTAAETSTALGVSQVAQMYAADFVATAAHGNDLNDAGDVIGTSYRDTGCGSFCLPPQDIVVWRGGTRTPLPLAPGFPVSSQFPLYLNNQGLIAGTLGVPGSSTHVGLWSPSGGGYTARDLGVFPGTSSADIGGLDDQGRLVGWSTQGGAIPTLAVPFMWTSSAGMVNLAGLGYPNERPVAVSPGGKVVTWNHWYQLGNPASVIPIPTPPSGFVGAGSNGSAINDTGDQAHFLVTTSSTNLVYPFRLSSGGAWQQISSIGTGRLAGSGIGGINAAQDIALTVQGAGMIAAGPTGLAQGLAALISPAYPGVSLTGAGAMNASGQILAGVIVGRSSRVMRLTPVVPCAVSCVLASQLALIARFVEDPARPGSCIQGGKMYNLSTARVTITDERGNSLANARVSGRFLDDYWTDQRLSAVTDASGVATFTYKGPCGVGAIAFLVDDASLGTRTFDRTRGVLTTWAIPNVAPPNQPPVAAFTVSCNNTTGVCVLDASSSTDDNGLGNLTFRWTAAGRPTKTGVTITRICDNVNVGCTITETLTVTDAGGLSSTKTVTFSVGRTPINQPPVAAFTVSCSNTTGICVLDASSSTDDNGLGNLTFTWTAPGWPTQSGVTTTRTCASLVAGCTIIETLTATDAGGLSSTKTVTYSVRGTPVNQPPVAAFTVSCSAATHGCTLDASSSTDDGGLANLTFTWTNSARPTKTGKVIRRSCDGGCPATITETLTVRDAGNLTASITKTFTIP